MNPLSSSTSSSDERAARRRGLATLGWAALWLVVIDIAANLAFPYPDDPKDLSPSPVALYLDYGRSMEGRLRRATRADPAETAPITLAGWYEPLLATQRPAKPGGTQITVYGMSHSVRLADALQDTSSRYYARSVAAPGAGTNWSYGAFLRDKGRGESRAAVLAIMSSTLPMIVSPTPMSWNTSFAMPYTADRFVPRGTQLDRIAPPYESFPDFVRTFNDPAAWQRAVDQFERTDPFYDPFLVRQSWLDNSTIYRLIRRGWAQRRDRELRSGVLTADGYEAGSEAVRAANAIIANFSRQARAQGIVPVIYIVDSFGYRDQLYRALADTLRRERIPHLATHTVIDPMDPRGYLPDSHLTDANDRLLAAALEQVLDREMARAEPAPEGAGQF
jgi:hypothetical protein